jgi:uncharacterized protein YhaN
MKILELSLLAFGPFTDVALDLSAGCEGLHMILGPNEAGKSSALRALQQGLFGIPARSTDDFVHEHRKMRIGLTVRAGDGRILQFVRRKGNRNTLLAADGSTALDEAEITRLLSGLTEPEFRSRFALDRDELVDGGAAILQGGGELGSLLFQAGGGLRNLLVVQRDLERELGDLFKPTGTKSRINTGLTELKQRNDALRGSSLRSSEWVQHDTTRREIAARLEAIGDRLIAARADRRRLERLREASPLLVRHAALAAELTGLGDAPHLSEAFAKARLDAVTRREAARVSRQRGESALAELDHQLEELIVPAPLLAEAEAIERLREAQAADRKARKNLPGEEARLSQSLREARALVAELRPDLLKDVPASVDMTALSEEEAGRVFQALSSAAETLQLTRSQRSVIQSLSEERNQLSAKHEQLVSHVAELDEQISASEIELGRMPDHRDGGALDRALRLARDQGDLDAMVETAWSRVTEVEAKLARGLAQLPHWSGTLEKLQEAIAPTAETIDRFDADFHHVETEREQYREEERNATAERVEAETTLERLRQSSGEVPTEDDLARTRGERDRHWRLIRRAWEDGEIPRAEEVRGLLGPETSADPRKLSGALADAFTRSIERADAQADRLRRETERVAQQAAALAALHRARQRLEFVGRRMAELHERSEKLARIWAELWSPLGLEPLSPREMRAWSQSRLDLLRQSAELHPLRLEAEKLEARRVEHRRRLMDALRSLGESTGDIDAAEPLASIRARAETALERLTAQETHRHKVAEAMTNLRRERDTRQAELRSLEHRLEACRTRWAAAVGALSPSADVTPAEAAEMLGQSIELQSRIKEARETLTRIETHRREGTNFARDVLDLCARVAPDLVPGDGTAMSSVEQAALELLRRFRAADEARARRDALAQRREAEAASVREADRVFEEATRQLESLCREARCNAVDDLPAAEQRSRDASALRERMQELDRRLDELCGHEPVESFRRDALALDTDRLPDRLVVLDEEIQRLDAERAELNQMLGREQQLLTQMDGSAKAAEAAESAEELKARLAVEIEEYARIRLASVVLREAIERFRQRSQGPILERAGRLFARLTLGSFEGLRVDYDEDDRPVLRAVRGGNAETVGIEGLSLGTADQLYLALRLAGLEAYLERHDPIPLIVDDILIQFDDARSAAALAILGELASRTQVILFTHHEHVVRIARDTVDPGQLILHRLPGRTLPDSIASLHGS